MRYPNFPLHSIISLMDCAAHYNSFRKLNCKLNVRIITYSITHNEHLCFSIEIIRENQLSTVILVSGNEI